MKSSVIKILLLFFFNSHSLEQIQKAFTFRKEAKEKCYTMLFQIYRLYYLLSGGFFSWSKFQGICIHNIYFSPAVF